MYRSRPAGPPPNGYCTLAGEYPVGTQVTVEEFPPDGVMVTDITVDPPERGENKKKNRIDVDIEHGTTEATFTNAANVLGSCSATSSLSVVQVQGTNVLAYVPRSNWAEAPVGLTKNGIVVTNIEGNYLPAPVVLDETSHPPMGEQINSCASDSTVGKTVCTPNSDPANPFSNNVYIVENTGSGGKPQVTAVRQTEDGGLIKFTGGCCHNCGVAIDPIAHKAVIGVAKGGTKSSCAASDGHPGFEFLDLNTDIMESLAIPSDARQISEDFLIDPTSNPPRLLSPAEGAYCQPPGLTCHPNYEIADITYGSPTSLKFYQNDLTKFVALPPMADPDSAAADCSAGLALASIEFEDNPPQIHNSLPFIADVNNLNLNGNLWSAPSIFYPLALSKLGNFGNIAAGPIAIAQGTHEGILGQEVGSHGDYEGSMEGGKITAFRLNVPYTAGTPLNDWVTCDIGNDPDNLWFVQGLDPHTVTAYTSPGGTPGFPKGHSIAVIGHDPQDANWIAAVDLTVMLNTLPRKAPSGDDHHVCKDGTTLSNSGVSKIITFSKL